jgi:hypothetical protein
MRSGWNVAAGLFVLGLAACAKRQPQTRAAAPQSPAKGTPEWKIQNALSAAPPAIAAGAAVLDFPGADGQTARLKAGTNGWLCMPDDPATPGNDPVCGDSTSFAWYGAMMSHQVPHIAHVAMAYMLQGATDASNADPFKTKPDSGQEWVVTGPHVMIFVPDPAALRGMPTDWKSGGPYVMFAGTPYAHWMVPVASSQPGYATGGSD